MQKIWQQETDKRAGLFAVVITALIVCLLTGSAYGSGLLGSNTVGTDGITLPARKPLLQMISFPQRAAPDSIMPRPARKPEQALPAPMPASDAALYRRIFDLQKSAHWSQADKLIPQLSQDHLRGHILYQRYMHPSYKSSFNELESWLARYAELPGADRIHRLALNRKPASYQGKLRPPAKMGGIKGHLAILDDRAPSYNSSKKRTTEQKNAIRQLTRTIRRDVSAGRPTKALRYLEQAAAAKYLDNVERDQLRAHIATGYMNEGKIRRAYEIAAAAAKRSGSNAPDAGWIGGLTAWRLEKYEDSARLFEQVAASPFASSWMSSAGAYWASRAHMRAGNTKEVSTWLRQAAAHPRTFYGLIATRALGWDFDFNWEMPRYSNAHKQLLESIPAARRAMALVAAEQYHLAEDELRRINPGNNHELREALIAYAHEAGLPAISLRLAETTTTPDGALYDAALYPLVPWEPEGGYNIDRALINAIIRQESRFDPAARSGSGALGLMQLMPTTASFVAGDDIYKNKKGHHGLKDPATNLSLGQRYVTDLLNQNAIKEDLFSLAIAYNAGPGNLRKWKARLAEMEDDPLLFVETIPVAETRMFVEKVLANYWIYRLRLDQKTPSLDSVVAGDNARYVALDKDPKRKSFRIASN